jgi:hypothetical protein
LTACASTAIRAARTPVNTHAIPPPTGGDAFHFGRLAVRKFLFSGHLARRFALHRWKSP